MKRASAESIRNVLWRVYPDLRHIWLVDRVFELPNEDDVRTLTTGAGIRTLDLEDCDDYALQMHAYARLRHEKWAFGEVIGYLSEGPLDTVH
ncbi:unnamed protein product, partial [marine sediment metagenome]